jgi:hypothetical protein
MFSIVDVIPDAFDNTITYKSGVSKIVKEDEPIRGISSSFNWVNISPAFPLKELRSKTIVPFSGITPAYIKLKF